MKRILVLAALALAGWAAVAQAGTHDATIGDGSGQTVCLRAYGHVGFSDRIGDSYWADFDPYFCANGSGVLSANNSMHYCGATGFYTCTGTFGPFWVSGCVGSGCGSVTYQYRANFTDNAFWPMTQNFQRAITCTLYRGGGWSC